MTTKQGQPKIRLPLDITPEESAAIANAAHAWRTSKKALIIAALQAYGVNFQHPDKQPPAPTPNTPG